jgi:hypothetical protein
MIRRLHLAVGLAGLVAFVVTGQYMAIVLRGLADVPDGPRLLYRSAHLYLMWSSLVNLLIGFYFVPAVERGARLVQASASALLLAGPLLVIVGFFVESPVNDFGRVYTSIANYFALVGTLVHVAASRTSQPPAR